MKEKNIKVAVQYITAIAFSLVWGMSIGSAYFAGGGSMGQIILRVMIVTYAASAIGVIVGDISLYKGHKLSVLGIIAGLVLMAVAFVVASFILNLLGRFLEYTLLFELLGPFMVDTFFFCLHWAIVTSAFMVGYNHVTFLRREKQVKPGVVGEGSRGIRWAKTSFICSVSAWVAPLVIAGAVLVIVVVFGIGSSTSAALSNLGEKGITRDLLIKLSIITSTVLSIAALISGGLALWRIRGKEKSVEAAGLVHNGLVLCCLYLAIASGVCLHEVRTRHRARALREQHPEFNKLTETFGRLEASYIYVSLMNYRNKYGKYPQAEKWYDDVMISQEGYRSTRGRFDKNPIKYAMNPNAKPDSRPDTVLLFETKRGWNKFGGPELMVFDEQGRCQVVFNDGKIEFVERKDVDGLRWGNN